MTETIDVDLNFSLGGKVALVTGGASGIGSAIASAFAAKGAIVGVIDINEAVAQAKAAELGNGAKAFVCDVSDPQSVDAVFASALGAFGHVDIVKLLLELGADPNRFNPQGAHSHSTPLHQAALAGHGDTVRLLVEHGARLDIKDILWNGTPADWADHGGHPEIAAYLRAPTRP